MRKITNLPEPQPVVVKHFNKLEFEGELSINEYREIGDIDRYDVFDPDTLDGSWKTPLGGFVVGFISGNVPWGYPPRIKNIKITIEVEDK